MTTDRRSGLALLLTVLGLAGILTAQLVPNRHRIENDLADRSAQALTVAGQDHARVTFTGRDALVVTDSDAAADRARTIVAGIAGVRTVRTTVEAPAAVEVHTPPTFGLTVNDGTAVLTGTVPTAAVKGTLHDAAAAAFGAVDDRVTVATTVTTDPALTALPTLLRSLPVTVRDFAVRLDGGTLTIGGTAPSEVDRIALHDAARRAGVPVDHRVTVADLQPRLSAVPPLEFRTGSAELTAASRKSLPQVAALLEANPSARVRIEGHTDASGSEATNLWMSRARADAVRSGLAELGVSAARLTAAGYGESRPKVANDTAEHRAENRRVEMTVITG
ncbi:OmpA family protein [Actinoplanes sp. NPDC020271]|uniref:OmpA family protein n=1 Tax=Actinoplanes sp. NPDC020271 TaxID=3363896 RepID=UPI0037AFB1EA